MITAGCRAPSPSITWLFTIAVVGLAGLHLYLLPKVSTVKFPDLEQQVLRAIGMADRQDVAEVTFHFSGREIPQVTVVLEVIDSSAELGSFFSYLADYYTLVPKELPAASESAQ